jgi:opacity protein-like surface antigen
MKKIILTLSAIFALGVANAQEVRFGAKAGVNYATFTGDVEDVDARVGFQVGGFAEIKVSENFSVQPELMYSSVGAKTDILGTTVTAETNYIIIPVMAKFNVAPKFHLEAGPQVGFLTSAKYKADNDSIDAKDDFESTDFGLNLGLGFDFTENLSAGLRYTFGLSNIAKDNGDDKVQNANFALALSYKF